MLSAIRRRAMALACGAVIAGGVVALIVVDRRIEAAAEVARRSIEETMAASHELDLAAWRGGPGGAAIMADASRSARSPVMQQSFEVLRVCLVDPACEDIPRQLLTAKQVLASEQNAAREALRATRAAMRRLRLGAIAAIAVASLILIGVVLAAESRRPLPAPAAPPAEGEGGNRALERALRERLEQLYDARLRARENARFASFGEIAAGLSHGLKTPLASVRAAAQVAQAKLGGDHPARDNLDDVIDEVDGLVEQINRFLRTMGSGTPAVEPMAAGELVAPLDQRYAAGDPVRGVTWRVQVADDLPPIAVDSELCEMALRNLIDNAFLAAPPGTEVVLAVGPCEPPDRAGLEREPPSGELAAQRWVEISVIDQGAGIPKEIAQAEATVSSRPGGSGLGIAIARRIAARHGGAVVLYTEPDRGTCASFIVPPAVTDAGRRAGAASRIDHQIADTGLSS